ncbi:hypothetical protein K8I61_13660 [bacterium]|nr:hypothetical protein [bacterium]
MPLSSSVRRLAAVAFAVAVTVFSAACGEKQTRELPPPPEQVPFDEGPGHPDLVTLRSRLLPDEEESDGRMDASPRRMGTLHGAAQPEAPAEMAGAMPPVMAMRMSNRPVDEPAYVGERYRAIRVRVTEKGTNAMKEFEVPLGGSAAVAGTELTMHVVNFLPALKVTDDGVTTAGPDPQNPAAKVRLEKPGAEPLVGWMFQNMPTLMPVETESHLFTLLGPVEK